MESVSNISTIQETHDTFSWFLRLVAGITDTSEYPDCDSSYIGGELE